MALSKHGWYDSDKNIAIAKISGTPECLMDIDLIVADANEEWGSFDHKVYTIADISDIGRVSYTHMSYYARKMRELFKKRCEMSVVVSNSTSARFALNLFKFVSNIKLIIVSSLDEALMQIELHQKTHGIYPKLDI